jgi:hypothetical protein
MGSRRHDRARRAQAADRRPAAGGRADGAAEHRERDGAVVRARLRRRREPVCQGPEGSGSRARSLYRVAPAQRLRALPGGAVGAAGRSRGAHRARRARSRRRARGRRLRARRQPRRRPARHGAPVPLVQPGPLHGRRDRDLGPGRRGDRAAAELRRRRARARAARADPARAARTDACAARRQQCAPGRAGAALLAAPGRGLAPGQRRADPRHPRARRLDDADRLALRLAHARAADLVEDRAAREQYALGTRRLGRRPGRVRVGRRARRVPARCAQPRAVRLAGRIGRAQRRAVVQLDASRRPAPDARGRAARPRDRTDLDRALSRDRHRRRGAPHRGQRAHEPARQRTAGLHGRRDPRRDRGAAGRRAAHREGRGRTREPGQERVALAREPSGSRA